MFLTKILKLNLRSIFLNFYLLPFKQAIYIPLLIARKVKITAVYRGAIELNCNTFRPGMIQIGYEGAGSIDTKYERTFLDIQRPGKIVFNGRCFIGSGSKLCVKGNLSFGDNCHVTGRSQFICYKDIKIGKDCLISWDCLLMDTDFHKMYINRELSNANKNICLQEKVWIGCRTTILKGSMIPTGCVIGAGSIVCKCLEYTNTLYAGIPAVKVRTEISWEQ